MTRNNEDVLQRLTSPKPSRKGASEAQIAADQQFRRTTAKLVAAIRPNSQPVRART